MRSDHLFIGGLRVHYFHAGKAGCCVILLHGGGLDSARLSWSSVLPALAQSHRVFAPDLPGYGESDRPADFDHTIESYGRLITAFMDMLGVQWASFCGVSMGGALALHMALAYPQRVLRLIPVSSYGLQRKAPAHLLSYLFTRMPILTRTAYAMLRRSRAWTRASLSAIFADPAHIPEDLVDDVFDEICKPGAGEAFMAFQRHEVMPGRLRTNYLDQLSRISASTCFIHGDCDRLVPIACAREASRRVTGARLYEMRRCGHWPQRELPAKFCAAVQEFLDQ